MNNLVTAITNFFKALGEIPQTFWGIVILICAMWISVKYNSNVGYYFAGIGSTLCGMDNKKSDHSTNVLNSPKAEVTTDALDKSSTN